MRPKSKTKHPLPLLLLCLILIMCCAKSFAQGGVIGGNGTIGKGGVFGSGPAGGSAALVASGTNYNTSGGGTIAVSPTTGNWCSTAGHLIVAVEIDHGSSANAPSVPTDGGDTFNQDQTLTGGGRATWFSFPNCSTSRSAITCNPGASEHADCIILEFSGAATSSPYDTAVTSTIGTSGSTEWNGYSLASASNHSDISIMAAYDGTAVSQYVAGTGWTIPPACSSTPYCGNANDGDGSLYAYALNIQGQMGAFGTRPTSATVNAAQAFYKAGVNGTVAGSYPTIFINFSGGTNAGTPTVATLDGSTFGGQLYYQGTEAWLLPLAGNGTYDNTDEVPIDSAVTVQGSTKAAGTKNLWLEWNPSTLGTNDAYGYEFNAAGNQASFCYDIWYDNTTNPTVSETNVTEIKGNNGGRSTPLMGYNGTSDVVFLENAANDSSLTIATQTNELYYQCLSYNGNSATNLGPVTAYTASTSPVPVTLTGSAPTTGTQIIFYGVTTPAAMNGIWTVTKTGANTVTLNGSSSMTGTLSAAGSVVTAQFETITMYECGAISGTASCNPNTWTNLGTVGLPDQIGTTDQPVEFVFGHVSGGSGNINYRIANVQGDWINAVNLLGP
jgi:autotransporter-associated beta strand protein